MSYARFGSGSDVYVYAHVYGFIECCGCALGDAWDFHSPADIVDHLREHVAAGHNVPDRLLDEALYPPEDFVGMCMVHMCREDAGHDGDHTPTNNERDEQIRARSR
ncbi:hypothetical protein [Agromyces cerinus]|uniref:Uncharacterized protein n=1 Tax=Agromyces cerinus subsp. cerinus TaxID=232089 RepID=A0A1N6DP92_9MICO|nr:hypothetical protein [Agromyces cerinus]SIN72537.1 hypothetical protein SAMN05443544_0544 [Agromyces cerinus subsp. cerinus]